VNAINHAATALLIKKRWPSVPIVAALISVQLIEFLWVVFNLLGIEETTTAPEVTSISDIHLAHMPFSHSVFATFFISLAAWFAFSKLLHKPIWGTAIAIGIFSHILLDIATHTQDIEILPFVDWPAIGIGLYGIPILALVIETLYGIFCWWIFKGSKALLAIILTFNLAALSFYVPQVSGPETLLAGQPKMFACVILIHIIAGLFVVAYFSEKRK